MPKNLTPYKASSDATENDFKIIGTIDMSKSPPVKTGDLISKDLFPELTKFTQQMVAVSNLVSQRLEPIQKHLAILEKRISPIVQQLNRAASQYGPILVDLAERLQEFDRKLNEVHAKDMTFLPPFFGELTLPEVRALLFDTNKPAIEVYQKFFSDPQNIDLLWKRWATNKYFTPERLEVLKDALDIHVQGKFTLSIPVLINQLEGLILDIFVIDQKQIAGALQKGFPKDTNNQTSSPWSEAHVVHSILLSEVFNSSKHDNYKASGTYPNRPTIQHGVNSTYYKDPYASTRLIMLIDFICSDGFLEGAEIYKEYRKKKIKLPASQKVQPKSEKIP